MASEVEAKFKLTSRQYESIKDTLGKPDFSAKQRDTYYTSPKDGMSLRIREEVHYPLKGVKNYMTIKVNGSNQNGVHSSDEIETELGPDIEPIKAMWKALGLEVDIVVEKIRYEWKDVDAKLVLDEVGGLGYFMEIEVLSDNEAFAQKRIREVIQPFDGNLTKAEGGYPQLLKKKKETTK